MRVQWVSYKLAGDEILWGKFYNFAMVNVNKVRL